MRIYRHNSISISTHLCVSPQVFDLFKKVLLPLTEYLHVCVSEANSEVLLSSFYVQLNQTVKKCNIKTDVCSFMFKFGNVCQQYSNENLYTALLILLLSLPLI